jgi:hypothetical protein
MNRRNAPFIAEWILNHFAAGPYSDVVAGDLLEHYRQGRSRLWFWRQVGTAVLEGVYSDVRDNTLAVFRAITMGMLVLFLWNQVVFPTFLWVWTSLFSSPPFTPQTIWIDELIYAAIVLTSGWVIARFGGAQRVSAVLIGMISFLVFAVINAALGFPTKLLLSEQVMSSAATVGIGWVTARFGYTQRISAVLVFCSSFILFATIDTWRFALFLRVGGFSFQWDKLCWAVISAVLVLIGSVIWTRPRTSGVVLAN